ncbi:M23 family metallopeptidase [Endozoicomonas sp. G2_2]|uniref:M23 family metallopeptidase n=1 Tax=Endozoicomonas sp. G2_2 TaxID=2821092 RepID=UPI001FFE150C|nr:M23 family metallopeptidase [Endozoicomonas sp. G2_2]
MIESKALYRRRCRSFFITCLGAVLSFAGTALAATDEVVLPAHVQQGAMVIGKVPAGSRVVYDGRTLDVTDYGTIVFGVGRDARGSARVAVTPPNGQPRRVAVEIRPRDFPVERINGVPPKTVSPPPAIAERIAREQQAVSRARATSNNGLGFAQHFIWPVEGRISGRFGNQRIYNGTPGSAHSGMDIAAATGTPVKAPASGEVVLAEPDLYLTGGTVLIDHGYGIGSNFLHLSRLDVAVGDTVEQGEIIGAVGATGRATGPHLHWGMTWFSTRIDPLLVLQR